MRYWHHPESSSVFATEDDEELSDTHYQQCDEITLQEYQDLLEYFEDEQTASRERRERFLSPRE